MDATPHPDRPRPEARPAEAAADAPEAPASAPEAPAADVPGADLPGADVPGADVPGADVPGVPDAGPLPLGVERVPTGHAPVDALLERLGDADHLAADGHLAVYEDVHRGLRDTLAALDAQPQPGPPYDHRS